MRKLAATLFAALLLAACSTLSIEVSQFTGDLAQSYTTRLAKARGDANLALAAIEGSATVTDFFKNMPAGRKPTDYLTRIDGFLDDLRFSSALQSPDAAGLPRPGEAPGKLTPPAVASVTSPDGKTSRVEAGGQEATASAQLANNAVTTSASAKSGSQSAQVVAGAPKAVVMRALSALEKELDEFGTLLLHVSAGDMTLVTPDTSDRVVAAVERLHGLGRSILDQTEFPDFGKCAGEKRSEEWRTINPVKAFGGLGKSEFVVFKDDAGNYQVKSAIFDPGDVVQAASATATGIISTFAKIHGVPIGSASDDDAKAGLVSTPLMESDTADLANRAERVREEDASLRTKLADFRKRHLIDANGQIIGAFTANALPGETDSGHARRAIEEVQALLARYRKRVEPELKTTP